MSIFDNFIKQLNLKYSVYTKKQLAQFMFKKTVDVGTAVVNIIGATGIAGFKFHIPETETVKFENEITDNFIETGSTVQDHIAQRPVTLTLTGLVGDYFYSIHEIENLLAKVVPTVQLVKELIPEVSKIVQVKKIKWYKTPKVDKTQLPLIQAPGGPRVPLQATITKNKKLDLKLDWNFNTMDLFSLFQSLYKLKSAQTRAFLFFEALWRSRAPFSVETTWKRFDNMVVQSIEARRDRNADITEFTITCKQISFANTLTESKEEYVNRMEQQKAKAVNKGVDKGTKIDLKAAITEGIA